jgi:hypothetical protein
VVVDPAASGSSSSGGGGPPDATTTTMMMRQRRKRKKKKKKKKTRTWRKKQRNPLEEHEDKEEGEEEDADEDHDDDDDDEKDDPPPYSESLHRFVGLLEDPGCQSVRELILYDGHLDRHAGTVREDVERLLRDVVPVVPDPAEARVRELRRRRPAPRGARGRGGLPGVGQRATAT